MSDEADLSGYLGLMLGAITGALRESGHSPDEIHRMVDIAIQSRELAASIKADTARM